MYTEQMYYKMKHDTALIVLVIFGTFVGSFNVCFWLYKKWYKTPAYNITHHDTSTEPEQTSNTTNDNSVLQSSSWISKSESAIDDFYYKLLKTDIKCLSIEHDGLDERCRVYIERCYDHISKLYNWVLCMWCSHIIMFVYLVIRTHAR